MDRFGPALFLFFGAAIIVLSAACLNVASLLLARNATRTREFAIRLALGASQARLAQANLADCIVLSAIALLLGLPVAWGLVKLVLSISPPALQLNTAVLVSPGLVISTLGITSIVIAVCGLWPAFQVAKTPVESALRGANTTVIGGATAIRSLRRVILCQVALSVVVLSFTGLFGKNMAGLLAADLGFRKDQVLTFSLSLPKSQYNKDSSRFRFWSTVLTHLARIPGVQVAAGSDSIPFGELFIQAPVRTEGQVDSEDFASTMTRAAIVSESYFDALGISLLKGQGFENLSVIEAELQVVVNESFVHRFVANSNPIGVRIRIGNTPWARIVGVISDTRYFGPANSQVGPEAYIHYSKAPNLKYVSMYLTVPESTIVRQVREVVRDVDSEVVVSEIQTMEGLVYNSIAWQRHVTLLVAILGLATLLLTTVGLVGVQLYSVLSRTREIALRVALGGGQNSVVTALIISALKVSFAGSAVGMVAFMFCGHLAVSLLNGVKWYDPIVLLAVVVGISGLALFSTLLPALYAVSVHPAVALRNER